MEGHLIDAVVTGVLIGLYMAISVGPTLFAVIKYSVNHSYKAGLAFVLGVSASDIMYVTLANVAASWLELLQGYERYIAYGGGSILVVVGLAGIIKKYKPTRQNTARTEITGGHYVRIWLSGFLINTINPGVLISWLAAVGATANTSGRYRFVLFGTCLLLILGIDFLKIFLADTIRQKLTQRRIIYVQKTSSVIIMCLGATLLVSTAFNIHIKKQKTAPAVTQVQLKGK